MVVACQLGHPAVEGEGLVGLIEHHQAGGGRDDLLDAEAVENIAGGVVGIGDPDNRRLMFGDGSQHRRHIKRKVGRKRHRHEAAAGQASRDVVHHESGYRRDNRRARSGGGHRHDGDEFVRAVAQQQPRISGHAKLVADQCLQAGVGRRRIAVDGNRPQPLAKRMLQFGRQAIGVFHRVKLEQPRGSGHVIARHREHLGSKQRGRRAKAHGRVLGSRISALRAWACSPSP